uniref:Uncharacterized protein n=1 Tax=Physcomitrium patens TaxID=3218 RepID=A9SCR0_PHYPA|nr:hypothetical protein PHYPA_020126 [Physcomitrium patens]
MGEVLMILLLLLLLLQPPPASSLQNRAVARMMVQAWQLAMISQQCCCQPGTGQMLCRQQDHPSLPPRDPRCEHLTPKAQLPQSQPHNTEDVDDGDHERKISQSAVRRWRGSFHDGR